MGREKILKDIKVLDSWALLAYFEGEANGVRVKDMLKQAGEKQNNLLLCAVNWGEVLYVIESRRGTKDRDQIEQLMAQMHLEVVPADQDLVREAAHFKASRQLPYADCFAAALAKIRKGILVTGDRDFKRLGDSIKIDWL